MSLVPYLRRLIITGFDREGVLHGFFGDDWRKGVAPLQECERRNYMFTVKSIGWAKVKYQYDMNPHETVADCVHNGGLDARRKGTREDASRAGECRFKQVMLVRWSVSGRRGKVHIGTSARCPHTVLNGLRSIMETSMYYIDGLGIRE